MFDKISIDQFITECITEGINLPARDAEIRELKNAVGMAGEGIPLKGRDLYLFRMMVKGWQLVENHEQFTFKNLEAAKAMLDSKASFEREVVVNGTSYWFNVKFFVVLEESYKVLDTLFREH